MRLDATAAGAVPGIGLVDAVAGMTLVLVVHRHHVHAYGFLVGREGLRHGIIHEDAFIATRAHGVDATVEDLDALRQARRLTDRDAPPP